MDRVDGCETSHQDRRSWEDKPMSTQATRKGAGSRPAIIAPLADDIVALPRAIARG
jgi:hypothetical protein